MFLRIFGTSRATTSLRIAAHATQTNRLFLRNSTDTFALYERDVGDITRLSVWVDGRNLSDQGASWHLAHITVRKITHGGLVDATWTFRCNKQLDVQDGKGKVLTYADVC